MVLGELIEDESGKVTGHRVLDIEGPKIERSFTMTGKYKEIEATDIGTFWTVMREAAQAEPVMYAEAQGVITAKDGNGMATYVAQGIGRFTSPGKIRFHGSVFYQTTSTGGGNLSFLNNVVGVFEYEGDEQGDCSVKVWEWK
ncbi:MAG TPA: hypothetical protein VD710_01130 [Nitrososphaeraceae archaeon]|nr:hypothetical protein [Nitrososphaeraceae archaeon]